MPNPNSQKTKFFDALRQVRLFPHRGFKPFSFTPSTSFVLFNAQPSQS
jgi:hypothetical protein